jgi:hypothetical protein
MKILLMLVFLLSCKEKECANGALNFPKCDKCPTGKIYMENQCAVLVGPPEGK